MDLVDAYSMGYNPIQSLFVAQIAPKLATGSPLSLIPVSIGQGLILLRARPHFLVPRDSPFSSQSFPVPDL